MMGNSLLRFPRAASHWCLQVSLLIGFICVLSFRISCYPALIQPLPCGPAFVTSLSDTKNYLLEHHCPIPVPCWPSRRKWRGRADRKLSVKGKGNCRHFCQKICKMQWIIIVHLGIIYLHILLCFTDFGRSVCSVQLWHETATPKGNQ